MSDDIEIGGEAGVRIGGGELSFRASRAGGAGGQHVNTSSTRIELIWNVDATAALDEAQRALVRERLASRIDGEGNLRIVASRERSQHQNRREAVARFREILERALQPRKKRYRTRPPRAAKEARLRDKKKQAEKKKSRRGEW
jgi:ribosome-associated protein